MIYRNKYIRILSQKKSSEVRIGQIAEHFTPFLSQFNHDPKQARFIGMPVDFIVFEDDGIFIVEVKTGKARLSTSQNKYKKLVEEGKVYWEEIKIQQDGVKTSSNFKLDTTTGRYDNQQWRNHPDLYPDPYPTGVIPNTIVGIMPPK